METDTINSIVLAIATVASAGWAASETLAEIPSIKANSVFQLIRGFFKKLAGKE